MRADRIMLPPLRPASVPVVLAIAPGEQWCCRCGESTSGGGRTCSHCGKRQLVLAVSVLRPEEYRIVH